MTNTQNTFTITIPEMREYRNADRRVKASAILFFALSTYGLLGSEEIPDPAINVAMGCTLLLSIGLGIHGHRLHKRLAPIINRTFAEQFTARTGFQRPYESGILDCGETIFALSPQGTPLAWDLKSTKHGFTVTEGDGREREIADDVRYWV